MSASLPLSELTAESPPSTIAASIIHYLTSLAYVDEPPVAHAIVFHDGFFWLYSPTGWRRFSPHQLVSWVIRLTLSHSLSFTPRVLTDVVRCMEAMTELDPSLQPPCWRGHAVPLTNPDFTISTPSSLIELSPTRPLSESLYARDPAYFDPITIPLDPSLSATCPRWLSFLSEISSDPAFHTSLQQFFGYCLLPTNSVERILFLHGCARSGKSTILEILRDLLGHQNCSATTLSALGSQFGRQTLLNRRLITLSEAHAKMADASASSNVLKQIVGRDRVFVDIKRSAPIDTFLPSKIAIVSNDLPHFDDANRGITSKLIILPFSRSFEGREDATLRDTLRAELPGIFTWALQGALSVVSAISTSTTHTLFPPVPASADISETIAVSSNPVRAFASDCLVPSPHSRVKVRDLYACYVTWCEANCIEPCALTGFGKLLAREMVGSSCKMTGGIAARSGVSIRRPTIPLTPATPGAESGTLPS